MKPGLSLSAKILLTAATNFALLAVTALAAAGILRDFNPESLIVAMAREKIVAASSQLALDLADTAPDDRTALLARYSTLHGVAFLLFRNDGTQLGGPPVQLPPDIDRELRHRPNPPPGPPDRQPRVRDDDAAEDPPPRPPREARKGALKKGPGAPPFVAVTGPPRTYWVIVRIPVSSPASEVRERGTLILQSPSLLGSAFFFDWRPWAVGTAVILTVTFLCWLPLLRGIAKTIHELTEATTRIARGDFQVRIETGRNDELGRLGASIDSMAKQLEAYVHGQKRFLRDAAHELRSPLARMQVAAAILEGRAGEGAAPFVTDLEEEIDLMSGLTTQLLSLARSETRPEPGALRPVNIREAVERAATTELTGYGGADIQVDPAHTAIAEPEALFRSLSNLLRNSIRYAGAAGPATVSSAAIRDEIVITVADRGPGIPEEALPKVFTPFFRLEEARDRASGGTGLGMAIAKAGIEACGGSISCRNREGGGLEITIRLKRA